MSNKIGRFEILSEISKSSIGFVYKANDPENSATPVKCIPTGCFD